MLQVSDPNNSMSVRRFSKITFFTSFPICLFYNGGHSSHYSPILFNPTSNLFFPIPKIPPKNLYFFHILNFLSDNLYHQIVYQNLCIVYIHAQFSFLHLLWKHITTFLDHHTSQVICIRNIISSKISVSFLTSYYSIKYATKRINDNILLCFTPVF